MKMLRIDRVHTDKTDNLLYITIKHIVAVSTYDYGIDITTIGGSFFLTKKNTIDFESTKDGILRAIGEYV